MIKTVIAIPLSILVFVGPVAAKEGVADSEGTIHFGMKLGPTNIEKGTSAIGWYGGYTIIGPGIFMANEFVSKLSVAIEGEYIDLGSSSAAARQSERAGTYGFAGAATFPMEEKFGAIFKAGVSSVQYKVGSAATLTKIGIHLGVAGQYQWATLLSLRFGYDIYPAGYSMTSASAVYRY